jgi:hypothetical protein
MDEARTANRRARRGDIWAIAGVVLGACGAIVSTSAVTGATLVDPTRPVTVVVGPPAGIAPMARVDGGRTGRSPHLLPVRPKVAWRRASHGGLDLGALAVDAKGAIVVPSATQPEVSQLSPDGAATWRSATGRGPSIAGAALLGDGTRVVATSAGDLFGFAPDGVTRFAAPLDLLERNARVGLLPLDDGGIAIASGQEVSEVDADGTVRQKARLGERTMGPLLATRLGTIATTSSGGVYLVRPGYARRIGTFGGEPSESGASTVDGRTLWAVVDHQRVVALDLANGTTQVRFAVTDQSLHGPVVFGRSDTLLFTTWTGVLVMLDPNGAELRRTSLEPRLSSLITDAGKVDFAALEESPAPIADADGRVAFARVGGRIGVVAPDGSTSLVANPGCPSPAALSPAGPKRFAVGCRDGTVLLVGDETP